MATCPEFFKVRLRAAALEQQATLFAKADVIDAEAVALRRHLVMSPRIDRLLAAAASLRADACRIGDRYFALVSA